MSEQRTYTQDEVESILIGLMNLGNCIRSYTDLHQEGESDMAKRIKERVTVNGKEHWITGESQQGVFDSYLNLCCKEGIVAPMIAVSGQNGSKTPPLFGEYMDYFMVTFKNKLQKTTMINVERIIRNHIRPKYGNTPINQITTGELQKWFDQMAETYSKETLMKIKNIMSPVFDGAVEDEYITRNPLKSSRLIIGGRETVHHKAIPADKMKTIRDGMWKLEPRERRMCILLSSTGMRFEEVLGLRWEDIDAQTGWITVQRAVVHPTRNMPEVKMPKTESSIRQIPITFEMIKQLTPVLRKGFVLSSGSDKTYETPMSYTEARRCFNHIREAFDIQDYSAHDFRDTCATEWRERGIPTDVIARLLGHSKSEITEKRYVKYRTELYEGVRTVMDKICDTKCDTKNDLKLSD